MRVRDAQDTGASARAHHGLLVVAGLAALAASGAVAQAPAAGVHVGLLDNGDFREELPGALDSAGIERIPWWITTRGAPQLEQAEGSAGERVLSTHREDRARQPIAAFAPLVSELRVSGRVHGRGEVSLFDGREGRATIAVGEEGGDAREFALTGRDFEAALGRPLVPRLVLELSSSWPEGARWSALDVQVMLPSLDESALGARIESELAWIFATFLERSTDEEGPRATAFITHAFDVVSGERLADFAGGFSPLYQLMLPALEARERPDWRAAFERHLADLFDLALHPDTGLPRAWNGAEDVPDDEGYVEIAGPLAFLLDLAERGPEAFRERARASALAIGETVLARGVLPDGNVAPRYRPRDAQPDTSVPHIRALKLPAQLARLAALTGDHRFVAAAEEALARFEYTHFWPGSWIEIDPGFDDEYGNFGACAVEILRAFPGHPIARRIAVGGWEHYAPSWRDALRLGGNVAADQVRCWKVGMDLAELEGFDALRASGILRAAVRSHFKGQQYGDGAWGDVTVYGFDPKDNLQVGDLPGLPQNLMQGLAFVYDERVDLGGRETLALYAAVLESSIAAYRRPYGYLATRRELKGRNLPYGSLRMAAGLVEMLRRL